MAATKIAAFSNKYERRGLRFTFLLKFSSSKQEMLDSFSHGKIIDDNLG